MKATSNICSHFYPIERSGRILRKDNKSVFFNVAIKSLFFLYTYTGINCCFNYFLSSLEDKAIVFNSSPGMNCVYPRREFLKSSQISNASN